MRRCALFVAVVMAIIAPAAPASSFPAFRPGYWLVAGDGGVFGFGVPFYGSAASDPTRCMSSFGPPEGECFAIAATPNGGGYWILNGHTGKIARFGDAGAYGEPATSFAGVPGDLLPTGIAIESTPTGHGYWVLERELSGAGTVAHFGDAQFFGDTQSLIHGSPSGFNGFPVGLATTPNGKGYWEVHSDGGVFGFGNAHFYGSYPGRPVADAPQPNVVGIASTVDGKGYWLAADDGRVFAFGDATNTGDLNVHLAAPIVGIVTNPTGHGFWLVAADGGVFGLGGAPVLGSMGGKHLQRPVFGITARRIGPV